MNKRQERERRRGKRSENRHERRQQQHSGTGDWSCISILEGIEVFKPEGGGTYHIDVIPYIVGDKNKNADPGDEYFELSYPCYNNLGVESRRYIAIGKLLGLRDPVAEHYAMLQRSGKEWDDIKQFKPKWRQLMLVFVHEQAEKGLQLFEGAYGTFGELLDEEIKNEEAEYVNNFDDPDHGATLVVRFRAENIGQKNPWICAAKINFEEREDGFTADGNPKLAAEILKNAENICLDDCLRIPDYKTLKAALDGVPQSEEEDQVEDFPHTKPAKNKQQDIDEEDDAVQAEDQQEEQEQEEKPKQKSRKPAVPEEQEDTPWDDDSEPEPEKARKPAGKGKPAAKKQEQKEDKDEDWDENWNE